MSSNETTTEQSIEQLFIKTYGEIRTRLFNDKWIIPITATAVESAVSALAGRIRHYNGPISEDEFVEWCTEQSTQAARIETLYERYNKVVLKGAWSILKTSMDLGADDAMARDVAADAWASFILKGHLNRLTHEKGLVAWFYKVGRNAGRAWRTDRLRHRERHPVTLEDVALHEGEYRRNREKGIREPSWDDALIETATDPELEVVNEEPLAAD